MSEQNAKETPQAAQNGEVPWWRNHPWQGRHLYWENRNKNPDLLLQYEGTYVAWFPDGSGIRDADDDPIALMDRIKASGDNLEWYVFEWIVLPGAQI